jgi:hypothetical protein
VHEYRGTGGLVSLVLNLAHPAGGDSLLHDPAALSLRKKLSAPIKQEDEWAPEQEQTF